MNSFLAKGYFFNNQNVLTPDRTYTDFMSTIPTWLMASLALFFIIVFMCEFIVLIVIKSNNHKVRHGLEAGTCFGLILGALILIMNSAGWFSNDPNKEPYDENCEFRLTKHSNLIVKQNAKNHPKRQNDHIAHPYQLYFRADNKKLVCLAESNGKQIQLNDNTKITDLFTNYYYYVQKHHLTHKFTKRIYFVKDAAVTNANGVPQYVLKGDNITLKIKPNKDQAYQIYTDKG